jgi:hypothetical protein
MESENKWLIVLNGLLKVQKYKFSEWVVSTLCKRGQTRQAAPKKEPQSGEIFVENAWLVNFWRCRAPKY